MVNYSGLSFWPFCCHVTHAEAVRKSAVESAVRCGAVRCSATQCINAKWAKWTMNGGISMKGRHCNAKCCIVNVELHLDVGNSTNGSKGGAIPFIC